MREPCWRPFSYLIIHRQAAQDFLDAMARKGWELEKVRFEIFAKFRKTDRADLRYFIDFTDAKPGNPYEESDYRQLCADAGWEFVEELGYWNVYASAPGRACIPIQTDPAEEYERYRQKVARRSWLSALGTAAILGVYLLLLLGLLRGPLVPHAGEVMLLGLFSSTLAASVALLLTPLFLLWGAVYLLVLWRQLRQWKQDLDLGYPLSSPSPRWAGVWGGVKLAAYLVSYGFLILLTPLECLLNGSVSWGVPVGLLIGAVLLATGEKYSASPRFQRRAKAAMAAAAVLVVCMFLHGPIRSHFPGRLPMGPVLTEFEQNDRGDRADGLLGSSVRWWEYVPPAKEGELNGLLSVEAQAWITQGLADRAFALEDMDGMEEIAPGLWRWDGDDQGTFLLRRGNRWISVYWHDVPDPEALPAVMERYLEQ